jgi:glycosyltransferase involved in cell wall biosynthesis
VDVSVIVPVYNRSSLLNRALDSLIGQYPVGAEIIVVDDGSEEDIRKLVISHSLKPRYIRHEHNKGGGAARNTGIRAASGRFVTFLDSDDYYLPGKVSKQLTHILDSRDPERTISVCRAIVIDGQISRIVPGRFPLAGEPMGDYIFSSSNLIQTNTVMVSTALAKKYPFYEKSRQWEDWEFCLRLLTRAKAVLSFFPEPLAVYVDTPRNDRVSETINYRSLRKVVAIHRDSFSRRKRRALLANYAWHKTFPFRIIEVFGRCFCAVCTGVISLRHAIGILCLALLGKERTVKIRRKLIR